MHLLHANALVGPRSKGQGNKSLLIGQKVPSPSQEEIRFTAPHGKLFLCLHLQQYYWTLNSQFFVHRGNSVAIKTSVSDFYPPDHIIPGSLTKYLLRRTNACFAVEMILASLTESGLGLADEQSTNHSGTSLRLSLPSLIHSRKLLTCACVRLPERERERLGMNPPLPQT